MKFVEFVSVDKTFKSNHTEVHALKDLSFEIEEGEICVIVGEENAGKTTLLNLLGGLDTVTKGSLILSMVDISDFSKKQFTFYRRNNIGFVFQFQDLISNLTVLENVEIASQLSKLSLTPEQALKEVGLEKRMFHFPAQLSEGEQQRVTIARSLTKNPKLMLCDEPTGDLDYQTGKDILMLLQELNRKYGMTTVIATRNTALAAMANRVVQLSQGRIDRVILNPISTPVEWIEW